MGIKDLSKFLKKEVPEAFRNDLPLNAFGRSVCIDVPIFAHKFCQAQNSTSDLSIQFQKLIDTLVNEHNFEKIVLVFDGNKTQLKEKEREKRSAQREKYLKVVEKIEDHSNHFMDIELVETPSEEVSETVQVQYVDRVFPTKRDYDLLWSFFSEAKKDHVSLVKSTYEAEAMCARLVREKVCDVCLTEDSDSLAFLCPYTILHFRKETQCIVDLSCILENLGMTASRFQDFCILLGCDFADRLPLVGPSKLLNLHGKQPLSDLRECAQNACKDAKAIIDHRNQWAFVKQFFETCGFEIQT